jgi:hypothetical protein
MPNILRLLPGRHNSHLRRGNRLAAAREPRSMDFSARHGGFATKFDGISVWRLDQQCRPATCPPDDHRNLLPCAIDAP